MLIVLSSPLISSPIISLLLFHSTLYFYLHYDAFISHLHHIYIVSIRCLPLPLLYRPYRKITSGPTCLGTRPLVRQIPLSPLYWSDVIRYVMLYRAILCYVVTCYVTQCMLCMLYDAMLSDTMSKSGTLYFAMLCYTMICCAMICYPMLCCAMICYAILCYAMLCYTVFCCCSC
jgi:hypothetical protein